MMSFICRQISQLPGQVKGLCALSILLPALLVSVLFATTGLLHNKFERARNEKELIQAQRMYVAARRNVSLFRDTLEQPGSVNIMPELPESNLNRTRSTKEYEKCAETFKASQEENLQVIRNYPRGDANKYLSKIGGNDEAPLKMVDFPVIVTGMTRHFYPKSQGLFQSVHMKLMKNPAYEGRVNMIVYDLGLTRRQLKVLKQTCLCEVRRFPFEDFPKHVKMKKNYTWKPLIIQTLLMEFGFVWWVDTSVRFTTDNIDAAIDMAKEYSVLFRVSPAEPEVYSVAKQTAAETFKFLEEDSCKFRHLGEAWGGIVLVHFDRISKTVINAWAACALNVKCMAPVSLTQICDLDVTNDSRCHRFDQSVLSILVRRLYHEQNTYPFTDVMAASTEVRSDIVSFLEKCEPPPVPHCFL